MLGAWTIQKWPKTVFKSKFSKTRSLLSDTNNSRTDWHLGLKNDVYEVTVGMCHTLPHWWVDKLTHNYA